MGRQLGAEGLDTFRHTKLSMIDHAAKAHDFWWFPYSDAEAFPGPRWLTRELDHSLPPELEARIEAFETAGATSRFRFAQLVLDDFAGASRYRSLLLSGRLVDMTGTTPQADESGGRCFRRSAPGARRD